MSKVRIYEFFLEKSFCNPIREDFDRARNENYIIRQLTRMVLVPSKLSVGFLMRLGQKRNRLIFDAFITKRA